MALMLIKYEENREPSSAYKEKKVENPIIQIS